MYSVPKSVSNSSRENVISTNNKTKTENLLGEDLISNKHYNLTNTNSEVPKIVTRTLDVNDFTKSSTLTATCDIPSGTRSSAVKLDDMIKNSTDTILRKKDNESAVEVTYSKGRLIPTTRNEELDEKIEVYQMLNQIRMADDCHSYNAILEFGKAPRTVRLVTTQAVTKEQKLLVWFTPDILVAMSIPFLTPVNIQGEKNYKCDRCGKIFEYPNPLKIHLSLDCKDISMINIWKKLNDNLIKSEANNLCGQGSTSSNKTINTNDVNNFNFSLTAIKNHRAEKLGLTHSGKSLSVSLPSPELTSVSNPSPCKDEEVYCEDEDKITNRPSSVPLQYQSAFKPYNLNDRKMLPLQNDLFNPYLPAALSLFSHNLNSFMMPQNKYAVVPQINVAQENDQRNLIVQHAVDMETLVSNLGKSKQGHLCIYCGKIYSRKYGLKIHIRTHTGFKPLKCKYCLRPFGDPSNLNKHVRLHAEGETPYKCELCGKILVRRRDLERHMKSRHQHDYSIVNEAGESDESKEMTPTTCLS